MNLMLHAHLANAGSEKSVPARVADPGERFDAVLANPPFGKKSSTMIVGEDGRTSTEKDIAERDDFWATTSNKQLNFVQHIKTLLKTHGRARLARFAGQPRTVTGTLQTLEDRVRSPGVRTRGAPDAPGLLPTTFSRPFSGRA
jgi:23S rRNA A1618 N6-methylase RlmF